ncbi:hypothetical protein HID58_012564 [Brassica napus]|uniref:Uncharacterized protein n=1 Tax=Brassica napus TaxID=3708 RepID=A0ABQ8E1E9_BRANA|nr:hypothetical protein HID58_012564 [Brassica napus]
MVLNTSRRKKRRRRWRFVTRVLMFDRDGKSWDPGAKRISRIRGGSYGVGKSWGLSDDSRIEIKIKISKRSQWKRFWKGDTIGFFRNWFYFRFSEWMRNPEDRTKDPRGPVQETSPLLGDPDQVNLITGELENGLDLVSEFLEDGTNMLDQDKIIVDLALSGEGGMELGENHHTRKEIGPGLELDDEFQNLTDGEGKDIDQVDQVEAKEVADDDMAGDIGEGKGATVVEKKPGLRKPLFSVAVGNNSKFAQVLLSPRKRAAAKQSLRKGGGTKQVEEKGSSYPKQLPKP